MISICYHWLKTRLILWTLYKQHLLLPEIPTRAASCCCCCWQCCTENDLDKITGTAAEIIWISIIQKCHARIQGTWPRLLKSQIQILKYVKRTTVNVFESINEPRTTTIIHTVKSVRVGGVVVVWRRAEGWALSSGNVFVLTYFRWFKYGTNTVKDIQETRRAHARFGLHEYTTDNVFVVFCFNDISRKRQNMLRMVKDVNQIEKPSFLRRNAFFSVCNER